MKHGHARNKSTSRTYVTWENMKCRCLNSRVPYYKTYGGRGIQVCDRWLTFENFLADMGERPEGTSLDRIDNDGHYEPGNCRWVTKSEQQGNRACALNMTFNGRTQCVTHWAKEWGIPKSTAMYRYKKIAPFLDMVHG